VTLTVPSVVVGTTGTLSKLGVSGLSFALGAFSGQETLGIGGAFCHNPNHRVVSAPFFRLVGST
jgi:hypothetical protein